MIELLQRVQAGDRDAVNILISLIYEELKKLARTHLGRELGDCSLDATALVHETFLKMAGNRHPPYKNLTQFYGIVSRLMRQVLVDIARVRTAKKRGYGIELAVANLPDLPLPLDRGVAQLRDALQELEKTNPRKARLVEMRYFAGMTAEESSMALSISVRSARRELKLAQRWLRQEICGQRAASVRLSHSEEPIGEG